MKTPECFSIRGFSVSDTFQSGGSEIRTREGLSSLTVFKTAAFNHSAIPPLCDVLVFEILPENHIKSKYRETPLVTNFFVASFICSPHGRLIPLGCKLHSRLELYYRRSFS